MGEFASDIYLLATAYNELQKIQLTVEVTTITADLIYLQTQILDELQAWAAQRRGAQI